MWVVGKGTGFSFLWNSLGLGRCGDCSKDIALCSSIFRQLLNCISWWHSRGFLIVWLHYEGLLYWAVIHHTTVFLNVSLAGRLDNDSIQLEQQSCTTCSSASQPWALHQCWCLRGQGLSPTSRPVEKHQSVLLGYCCQLIKSIFTMKGSQE